MQTQSYRLQETEFRSPEETKAFAFSFHGSGGTLFGIQIVNLFLIIITLGIYYFWAKVKVRKYLWGQVDMDGDRLSYHGTPKEALWGWLKAALIFGIPFILLQNAPGMFGAHIFIVLIGGLLSLILISAFIPIAVVGMRRYRYSRTSLRGVRFSFRGRWRDFARIFCSSMLLNLITLSLYSPYYDVRKAAFFFDNTCYGNSRFGFDGKGSDLLGKYIVALLLALPTVFISMIWYSSLKTRYLWNHTTFQGARFRSDITFGGLLWLIVSSVPLLIFTLGICAPWVKVRFLRYYLGNLTLTGYLDFNGIIQDAREETATAEEIGDFLDMDFDLG